MRAFKRYAIPLILVTALVLTGPGAVAQGAVNIKLDKVDVSQFPQVTIHATVIDENGLPVTSLAPDRFELIEDGRASFPPDNVQSVSNDKAAVSVLVLIDLAGTMSGKPLQSAKEATAKFLEKLLNEGADPDQAAFMGFGQKVDITAVRLTDDKREVPFTNDMGKLLNVVNFVQVEQNRGTPLYDAVYRGVKITAQQPGRRAIIVMTDGGDVGSTLKDGDPIAEAQRQHIPIFPIGLSNSRLDKTYLQRLAQLTGGQYQEAPTPDQIGQKFEEVLGQLKVQYILTYQSRLTSDGQYHSLLLRVNTARGQNFDETKFQLGQPAAASTPQPGATAVPALPTPAPKQGDQDIMGDILAWINQNMLLAGLIVAAALLLLLMLIVFVVMLMRNRSAEAQPEWGAGEYGAPAPELPSVETYPGGPGAVPTSAANIAPGAAPTGAGTQVAPPLSGAPTAGGLGAPLPPPPLPAPPKPVAPPPPKEAPVAGGTVVIERKPKVKVLGMLVDRKKSARKFDIDKPSVTIGRAPGNTIIIDHPTVSRQHATIKLEGSEFRLYDLGSANGTFVGGTDKRLREPITLDDGMLVRFGEVEFVFKRVALE